jgi:ferrous iron transport protein B
VANYFILITERGWKTASLMAAFIIPFAFFAGAVLNWTLRGLGVAL